MSDLDTNGATAILTAIPASLLLGIVPSAFSLGGGRVNAMSAVTLLIVSVLGIWSAMVVLRFAWERLVATVPPGRYMFATGIVDVSRGGLVRFVPRGEYVLMATKVIRRRGASSTSYVRFEAKTRSGHTYGLRASASMFKSTDEEAARLTRQEARLIPELACVDLAFASP